MTTANDYEFMGDAEMNEQDDAEHTRATEEGEASYDPATDLTRVSGADYLEVKNRIKWLRDRDPNAQITSELLEKGNDWALFKATVTLTTGGHAEAHGSESKADFKDYVEKAETKAVGRALAMAGFGTQFVESELNGTQGARVVDAPVRAARKRQLKEIADERESRRQRESNDSGRTGNGSRDNTRSRQRSREQQSDAPSRPIADRQKSAILDMAKRGGYSEEELQRLVAENGGGVLSIDDLTSEEAGAVITALRRPRGGSEGNA